MQQAAFLVIANKCISSYGWDNRSKVVTYVHDELQKEFPASGKSWVVLYDVNGSFTINAPYNDMEFFAKEGGSRTEYLYAARV